MGSVGVGGSCSRGSRPLRVMRRPPSCPSGPRSAVVHLLFAGRGLCLPVENPLRRLWPPRRSQSSSRQGSRCLSRARASAWNRQAVLTGWVPLIPSRQMPGRFRWVWLGRGRPLCPCCPFPFCPWGWTIFWGEGKSHEISRESNPLAPKLLKSQTARGGAAKTLPPETPGKKTAPKQQGQSGRGLQPHPKLRFNQDHHARKSQPQADQERRPLGRPWKDMAVQI